MKPLANAYSPRVEAWAFRWRRFIPHRVRSSVFQVRRTVVRRLRGEHVLWVRTDPIPSDPHPLDRFGFYAIIGTWMEADVIADTVANAFAQGVDRVFLLDNNSPDDTVALATGAGADVVLTYSTAGFEEHYRYNLMNEYVRHCSESSDYDHVWWLWMDADEFNYRNRVFQHV